MRAGVACTELRARCAVTPASSPPTCCRKPSSARSTAARRCPGDVDVVRFLAGVMRSIASDWCKARRRWQRLQLVAPAAMLEVVMLQARDLRPTPDDALASEQEAARAISAIRDLFAEDAVALRLLEGMLDGLEGEALRSLAGLSETAFASKRRLIRRRIDKAFPRDREP